MTRREFVESITEMSELLEFCGDVECNILDYIYDSSGRDDYINEHILVDLARECDWEQVRDILNEIPTEYDYYYYDDGEWHGVDEYGDFLYWKQRVLDWCDEEGDVFSDDEDEEPADDDVSNGIEEPEESVELACPISELLQSGYDSIQIELLRITATKTEVPPGLPF